MVQSFFACADALSTRVPAEPVRRPYCRNGVAFGSEDEDRAGKTLHWLLERSAMRSIKELHQVDQLRTASAEARLSA